MPIVLIMIVLFVLNFIKNDYYLINNNMYKYILLLVLPFVIAEYDDACAIQCIEQLTLSGKQVNTSVDCLCSYQPAKTIIEYNCYDTNDNCMLLIRSENIEVDYFGYFRYFTYFMIFVCILLLVLFFIVLLINGEDEED
jgi:hypothetical protein